MKNKASLPLMEQLIMILVFAMTAALCLQGFSAANKMSQRQEQMSRAVVLAQNAAETLKGTGGDYEALAKMTDTVYNDLTNAEPYYLTVTPMETADPLLGSACVQVFFEEELIFEISVAWQEVS